MYCHYCKKRYLTYGEINEFTLKDGYKVVSCDDCVVTAMKDLEGEKIRCFK